VIVDESVCNVKDIVAFIEGVCMVDFHVDVDQILCNSDALDACTNIGKSKDQGGSLEECSVEMVSEVSSDVDYDCDVYEEEDELVSYSKRMMDGKEDVDSQ